MALFAIIRSERAINNDALAAAIGKTYPFYRLGRGQWIVEADETVRSLCENLGIVTGSHFGGTLVLLIDDYFGLHATKLWDWMKMHQAPGDS